jgi:hypothetical protein
MTTTTTPVVIATPLTSDSSDDYDAGGSTAYDFIVDNRNVDTYESDEDEDTDSSHHFRLMKQWNLETPSAAYDSHEEVQSPLLDKASGIDEAASASRQPTTAGASTGSGGGSRETRPTSSSSPPSLAERSSSPMSSRGKVTARRSNYSRMLRARSTVCSVSVPGVCLQTELRPAKEGTRR